MARKAKITIGSVSNWVNGRVETSVCKVYFEELVKIRKAEMESAMEEII
ncbi:MAG: hypothetical protein HYU67_11825 [Flavobacteriia bacterium]|nr:hypothetical protein [Flavobacteriia bacterium]